jgi:hypothetical protein
MRAARECWRRVTGVTRRKHPRLHEAGALPTLCSRAKAPPLDYYSVPAPKDGEQVLIRGAPDSCGKDGRGASTITSGEIL